MINVHSQFRDAMRFVGLEPPDLIDPGRLHRFPGVGKNPGNLAGWCLLFEDGFGGCFGDWSSGLSRTWFPTQDSPLSPEARAEFSRKVQAARRQAELSRQHQYAEAARRALGIWNAAPPAPNRHPYLITKAIGAHNARLHKSCIVLPIVDMEGFIISLQFIAPDGSKRLLSGGRKRGCFVSVAGDEHSSRRITICEGWATGCTLAEDDPDALVLAAIDAGNLEPVAVAARSRWPAAEIIIAGDDDRQTPGNPGATKANAAAIASDALLALPSWPDSAPAHLTDFNDLAIWFSGGVS